MKPKISSLGMTRVETWTWMCIETKLFDVYVRRRALSKEGRKHWDELKDIDTQTVAYHLTPEKVGVCSWKPSTVMLVCPSSWVNDNLASETQLHLVSEFVFEGES